MSNAELELKIKEILSIENFFDMIEKVVEFEKEYKGTSFYKKTKMPLMEVIKNSKVWYALQLKDVVDVIQGMIDSLNVENVNSILSQLGEVYSKENTETLSIINEFKDLIK